MAMLDNKETPNLPDVKKNRDNPRLPLPLEQNIWHQNLVFMGVFLMCILVIIICACYKKFDLVMGVFTTFIGSAGSFVAGKKAGSKK